jgi:hypothetical protein
LGVGGGVLDFSCDGCDVASQTGLSGFISLAGGVGEKTLLGVESTGWTKNESGTTAQAYSLMAHLTEYLNTTSGLFIRTGLGVLGYREDTDFGDLSANAIGFSGRLGYEVGTGGVVFVPYVAYLRTIGGAKFGLEIENTELELDISNFQFGFSIGTR